ncbi:efflux RND transporter periplasmic adaptor subunit [Clostridium fermenticellae]|nr:efflux RND transporter periplasmic adaptor subunit [Clostridium fermenticellae]
MNKVKNLIRKVIKFMKERKILSIVVVIIIIAAIGGGIFLGEKKTSNLSKKTNKVSVKVIEADMDTVSEKASFKASLEASEEGVISAKVPGKVTQVSFQDGQTVSEGETLAKVDDTDIKNNIKTAEAQLAAAKAQLQAAQSSSDSAQLSVNKPQIDLQTAQNNYNRVKALHDQGAASDVEFENAGSQLKTAESALESARASAQASSMSIQTQEANIQTAQTNLDNLNDSLQNTTIKSPTSGVITGKNVSIGQYLGAGTALGKVDIISPIYADIDIRESDLNYIKLGTDAKLKLNDDDKTSYNGVVKTIDTAADPVSRAFKCKVQIDNKDGKLKPGIFGKIQIATDQNKKVITVPVKAIGGTQGNYYVLIDNNGRVRKKTVTIGDFDKSNVEIKSGIQVGDSVICTNVSSLQDGDSVKIVFD